MPKAQSEVLSLLDELPGSQSRPLSSPDSIDRLAELASELLRDKNLEVSKVRPFFWSMVEIYVDRFQVYPFDVARALFSYLELRNFPENEMVALVQQLEESYRKQHGRSMKQAAGAAIERDHLADEISDLRDSLKYAGLIGELNSD